MVNRIIRGETTPLRRAAIRCSEACEAASQACQDCAIASFVEVDVDREPAMVRCLDCAAISTMCAVVVGRGSDLTLGVAALCAAACERCYEACVGVGEQPWQRCAEVCRDAAAACRELGALCERSRPQQDGRSVAQMSLHNQ